MEPQHFAGRREPVCPIAVTYSRRPALGCDPIAGARPRRGAGQRCRRRAAGLILGLTFAAPSVAEAGRHKLYVHTEGIEIKVSPNQGSNCGAEVGCGVSDASRNISWLPSVDSETIYLEPMLPGSEPGRRESARQELLAEIRRYFRGIGIDVTLKRPSSSEHYSMVVVGGSPADLGLSAGIAGLAPLDCDDVNRRDITFVFANAIGDVGAMARVAAQEAAHSYGLEHVDLRQFVMHPEPIGGGRGFATACVPLNPSPQLSNPDGIKCVHTCDSLGHQNTFAELQMRFGDNPDNPLPTDHEAPEVIFTAPARGAHFPDLPGRFRVDLDADDGPDGLGVSRAVLSINGGPEVEDPTFPFAFLVDELGPGKYELTATVEDMAGNHRTTTQVVYVGVAAHADPSAPPPTDAQIQPHLEDRTGEPVVCESDAVCYEGTVCIDDICTSPPPESCSLNPRGRTPSRSWLALLLLPLLRRR